MASIIDIKVIGINNAEKLAKIGIKTTEELLKKGATPEGIKEIEEKTGIAQNLILKWVNLAADDGTWGRI